MRGLELVGDDERCVALAGLLPLRLLAERVALEYSVRLLSCVSARAARGSGRITPVIFKLVYLIIRRFLDLLVLLARPEGSREAELLVLRHHNAVLRRQVARVRYRTRPTGPG